MNRIDQHKHVIDNFLNCKYCKKPTLVYIATMWTNDKIEKVCRNCETWNLLSFWPEMKYLNHRNEW